MKIKILVGGASLCPPEREGKAMAHLAHLYEPGMVYLLTSVTYHREPLFVETAYAQAAHEDIAFYTRKFRATSLSHVIMPDHIHWVVYPSPQDFKRFAREEQEKNGQYAEAPERFYLSKIMQDYKRHVSYSINRLRGTKEPAIWQDGFRDDGLRTIAIIRQAVRYVVFNPVKAKLVARPEDYPWLAWDAEWLV
jgi:REP element-mobilizing transposase RayT